ncbi:hypothetical protein JX265_003775 [Neoarthrinium moseri]|uniref:Cellulose-binding protein n=1 Tax=Neoarthrinium moseri TaxID=1658444 RepID=A0A9P9WSF6_9PEZI|nr:hypothetical protein JX265_003775 [Neoarthrinium moseri]
MVPGAEMFWFLLFLFSPAVLGAIPLEARGTQLCETSRYAHKHRVFILTDISNEPDDQMSLVRLLTYSNELDIHGIGVVTSVWKNDSIDIDTVHDVLSGYSKVVDNLNANVPASAPYPSADDLLALVKPGHPVYGLAALDLELSEAAQELIGAVDSATPANPLYVCLWGGAGVLAEALHNVSSSRSQVEVAEFTTKVRVYSISDQDDAGPWVRQNYPDLFEVVSLHGFSEYTQASWNGISGEAYRHFDVGGPNTSLVANEWLQEHIRIGDLGQHYPDYEFIMEGDTPSFFPLIPNGLGDPAHPEWGSWGGRYLLVDGSGRYPVYSDSSDIAVGVNGQIYVSSFAGIWRWRQAYQYDFAARMQWTVDGNFSANNHAPVVVLNDTCGPEVFKVPLKFGEAAVIDARQSWDPDGDQLSFDWFHYREVTARVQEGVISPTSHDVKVTKLDSAGGLVRIEPVKNSTMHIILSVDDDREMSLTTYRRLILELS